MKALVYHDPGQRGWDTGADSWPSTVPGFVSGASPLRMCRSVPQIVELSIRTTTSAASMIVGAGIVAGSAPGS